MDAAPYKAHASLIDPTPETLRADHFWQHPRLLGNE
jgi:hypothetical protein